MADFTHNNAISSDRNKSVIYFGLPALAVHVQICQIHYA